MPLKWSEVPLPIGGLDTRTDSKSVAPPSLAEALNARFTKPGTVTKREGYAPLAELSMNDAVSGAFFDRAITDAKALVPLGDSLCLLGAENVYALNAQRQRWKLAAQVPSVGITYGPTRGNSEALSVIDTAERVTLPSGIVVRLMRVSSTTTGLQVSFYDPSDTLIGEAFLAVGFAFVPKLVAIGSAVLVLYVNQGGTALTGVSFDTTSLTVGNPLSFTSRTVAADINATSRTFDVDISGGRFFVVYDTTTANTLKMVYLTPDGQLDGAATTVATAAAALRVACAVEPSARTVIVSWMMPSIPRVDGRMFTEALGSLFAATSFGVPTAIGGNVVATFRTSTVAEVFFDTIQAIAWQSTVQRAVVTTAGVVTTSATWLLHCKLAGKPWLMNGRIFLSVINDGDSPQSTLFIAASGTLQDPAIVAAAYPGLTFYNITSTGRPDVQGNVVSLMPLTLTSGPLGGSVSAAGEIFVDHAFVPNAVEAGRAAYYTGGALWMLDGRNAVENGFWLFPNNLALSQGAGGSQTLLATYSYQVFYEWFSAVEERWISTFAGAQTITLTGANGTVTVTVPTLTMTNKVGVRIAIYRTLANGSLFFRCGSSPANDKTVQTVALTDGASDASIQTNELSYVTGGVLDNIAPLACSSVAVGNNRVFISGLQDPNLVWASQLQAFGTPLNFNDEITIALPPARGGAPVTALAMLGTDLIAFRARHIYGVAGPGPNNAGVDGIFETPVVISDEIGCVSAASVVRTSEGLMFMSQRGIYLLANDRSLSYVGAGVEAYNSETITSAIALATEQDVRFTTASGKTLVFDYLSKAWAVWSIGGAAAAEWQDTHVVLRGASGLLLQQTPGTFLDNGQSYTLAIEFGWAHLAGMQGYQRVRELLWLGERMAAHLLLLRVAYDNEMAWVDTAFIDLGATVEAATYGSDALYGDLTATRPGVYGGGLAATGLPATSVYQWRHFFWRPKCEAVKLRFEDAAVAGSPLLDSFHISDVTLKVGLKAGAFKPGPDRQV